MEVVEKASAEFSEEEEVEEELEEVDLFGNKRRQSLSVEGARRASLGLPDNGAGMTKDYYNISRPMSVTSLVDLIVLRRTGNESRPGRRSTQLSPDLEERIKKTLAWKEVEDELNKEDVMVNFRRKMRELRKEARQSIPKETRTERKINEERRIQLRTSLMETDNKRRSTTESVKEAIQEFRMKQPSIIEEPQVLKDYEEDKEASDIIHRTRELLEQMGYLKGKVEKIEEEPLISPKKETMPTPFDEASSQESETGSSKKRRKGSQSGSEKSLGGATKSISRARGITPRSDGNDEPLKRNILPNLSRRPSTQSRASTPRSSASSSKRPDSKQVPVTLQPTRSYSGHPKKRSTGQVKPPLSQSQLNPKL